MPPRKPFVEEPVKRPRNLANRCLFANRGRPTTKPGTPDDEKRIKLSKWLTRLIGDGDNYATPGADGYSPEELASAESHYAHLAKRTTAPEPELQMRALGLLRAGVGVPDIAEDLEIPAARFAEWRRDELFAAEWESAKAEGKGQKVRSNAVRDAATAPRVPQSILQPLQPVHMPTKTNQSELQGQVLARLRKGERPGEIMADTKGFNGLKLAEWRKEPDFARQWDEAKAAGRSVHGQKPATTKAPRFIGPASTPESATPEALAQVTVLTAVNGPAHYNGTETFDQMLMLFGKEAVASFCRLNAYKYRMRAGKKAGNSIEQDISKALWYENQLQQLA